MKWIVPVLLTILVATPTFAASFDCAKAGTKVEHMICDNPEISKLDEDLNAAYKTAVQNKRQAEVDKSAQKGWMLMRNSCADAECVKWTYQTRISVLSGKPRGTKATPLLVTREEYALIMSKNDEMCNHMLLLMNDDLKKNGRTFDRHDSFVNSHKEFNIIPWEPESVIRNGKVDESWKVDTALFDLNNDGTKDFVVLEEGMLSGMRADSLFMLDAAVAKRENGLTADDLREAKNYIHIAGWFYNISIPTYNKRAQPLWLLSPFIYNGVSFVFMQSLYKSSEAIRNDFVVIAKYIDGKFEIRQMTGKMEDICYIERVDAVERVRSE